MDVLNAFVESTSGFSVWDSVEGERRMLGGSPVSGGLAHRGSSSPGQAEDRPLQSLPHLCPQPRPT